MKTAAKLSAYGAALALLLAGGYATGTAAGPLSTATADSGGHEAMSGAAPWARGRARDGTALAITDGNDAERTASGDSPR
jgi:hypothetical protein